MNKDFIDIIREIRGSGQHGVPYTSGIWYELTIADTNGNPGIYGDILAKYGIFLDNVDNIEIIRTIQAEIVAVAAIIDAVIAVVANSSNINIVSTNISDVNILADALGTATISGGGQFLGTSIIKGIQYMSQTLAEEIVIPAGLNAFSIESLELQNGASITVNDGATYKVL